MQYKKIISLMMVFMMLYATQLTAEDLGSIASDYKTDFGTWKSPVTGTKYFYGGSYTFAFKGSNRYQPLFQGEGPSFKTGCAGFSLHAGFIALLGIDEIKLLLKNAGATLAWGAMMALQLTLPSLFNVFNTLRRFARELQKILSNSCRLGTLIAQNGLGIEGNKIQMAMNDNAIIKGINDYAKSAMSGFEHVTNMLSDFNKDIDKGCALLTGDAYKKCMNRGGSETTGKKGILNIAKNGSNSVFSYTIGSYANDAAPPDNKIYVGTLDDFFKTGKIGGKVVIAPGTEKLKEMKTTMLISRLLFGDFATSAQDFEEILKNFSNPNAAGSDIASGNYEINGSKTKSDILASITSQNKPITGGRAWLPAIITSPDEAANALLNGISKSVNDKDCSDDGTCRIPNNYIYFVNLAYDEDGKQKVEFAGILNKVKDGSNSNTTIEWKGAFIESLKAVRKVVKDKTGYTPTHKSSLETGSTPAISTDLNTVKIPLLLPNISKYIADIALIEKKAKGETPYTAQLKSIVARHNAYMFATSLADLATATIIDAMGRKGHPSDAADISKMMGYIKDIKDKREKILNALKADQNRQITYQELVQMFKDIETSLKKENLKGY